MSARRSFARAPVGPALLGDYTTRRHNPKAPPPHITIHTCITCKKTTFGAYVGPSERLMHKPGCAAWSGK